MTFRVNSHQREKHSHVNCGARLDQIAAPRPLDDTRPYDSVRELTELPVGEEPDNGERREDEPTPEPRGHKADQSEEQRGAPDGAEAGLLIHHFKNEHHVSCGLTDCA